MSANDREHHWARVRARYAALARTVIIDPGHDDVRAEAAVGAGSYREEDLAAVPTAAGQAAFGCGNPVAVADLQGGEVVLDLGSGGGLDVILSARQVGPGGLVFGLDMTEEMLALARANAEMAGTRNAIFLRGRIEDIPLPADSVDVVISNCAVNLSPDKDAVFAEVARVLRPGGRLRIADVVAEATPADGTAAGSEAADREAAGWGHAGAPRREHPCAGALTVAEYHTALVRAGLGEVEIRLAGPVGEGTRGALIRARMPAAGLAGTAGARGVRAGVSGAVEGGADTGRADTGRAAGAVPRGTAAVSAGSRARYGARVAALELVRMSEGHWPAVAGIYAAGIATGNATFEELVPSWADWDHVHLAGHRLVALLDGEPAGWAALAPVSGRCVYAGVAENSVYVGPGSRGAGVGRALLTALIEGAERDGIWTVQAGIFPENEASLALHRACGFRVVGRREKLGLMAGRWRDVLLLERRSPRMR